MPVLKASNAAAWGFTFQGAGVLKSYAEEFALFHDMKNRKITVTGNGILANRHAFLATTAAVPQSGQGLKVEFGREGYTRTAINTSQIVMNTSPNAHFGYTTPDVAPFNVDHPQAVLKRNAFHARVFCFSDGTHGDHAYLAVRVGRTGKSSGALGMSESKSGTKVKMSVTFDYPHTGTTGFWIEEKVWKLKNYVQPYGAGAGKYLINGILDTIVASQAPDNIIQ